jgi:hypothetical protein
MVSPQSASASVFDALGYVVAVTLFGVAVTTARSDPHGLLNLGTRIAVASALVAVIHLRMSSLRAWQRASAWARTHRVRLAPLLLAVVLAVITGIRFALRLQLGGAFVGSTVVLWICAWSMLLVAVWPAGVFRRLISALPHQRLLASPP